MHANSDLHLQGNQYVTQDETATLTGPVHSEVWQVGSNFGKYTIQVCFCAPGSVVSHVAKLRLHF